jgi:hypothetical protein
MLKVVLSGAKLAGKPRRGADSRMQSDSRADELLSRISKLAQAHIDDWRPLKEEILEVHEAPLSERERVLCLTMMKALMDAVEHQCIEPENLQKFRETRRQEYHQMLVKEALMGRTDGIVDPVVMASITFREVRDGRMASDDEFHELAVSGAKRLVQNKPTFASRIRSWFR